MPAKSTKKPSVTTNWLRQKYAASAAYLLGDTRNYMAKRPHRSFRQTARPGKQLGGKPLPGVWAHLKDTFAYIRSQWRSLALFSVIYAIVTYAVIGGITQLDFITLKDATDEFLAGSADSISRALALYSAAVSGQLTENNDLQQFLRILFAIFFWLSLVWFMRMRMAGNAVNVRDALYNSGAPVLPTFLILVVIAIQAIPGAAAIFVFSVAQGGGFIQQGGEIMLFAAATFLLCLLSLYWIVASLMALVVVTLPQIYPWAALSSASQLVIGQRWKLVVRLIVLTILMFVLSAAIFIPILLLDSWLRFDWLPLVPITFQAITAVGTVVFAVYCYRLYRSMLHD